MGSVRANFGGGPFGEENRVRGLDIQYITWYMRALFKSWGNEHNARARGRKWVCAGGRRLLSFERVEFRAVRTQFGLEARDQRRGAWIGRRLCAPCLIELLAQFFEYKYVYAVRWYKQLEEPPKHINKLMHCTVYMHR